MGRLRATADNGKAIQVLGPAGRMHGLLKSQGFRCHNAKQPDGTYLAWCERIDPVKAP